MGGQEECRQPLFLSQGSPRNPTQAGFSGRVLGPLITRKAHGHYWPSPGHTSGWAPISSKLRGSGGGVPRIPSEWCILGPILNSDPVPVARGNACAGWPILGHHVLNPEPIPVIRAKAYVELHRGPPNDMDWELVRWFLQGNQCLASKEGRVGWRGEGGFILGGRNNRCLNKPRRPVNPERCQNSK